MANSHRILTATLTLTMGLVSGAQFGQTTLVVYQLAQSFRHLDKPQPSPLIAGHPALEKPSALA